MSTGLTYVCVVDPTGQPETNSPVVFSDYSEAYNFGEWYSRVFYNQLTSTQIIVAIWTSGPNDNGYWYSNSGSPTFTIYD